MRVVSNLSALAKACVTSTPIRLPNKLRDVRVVFVLSSHSNSKSNIVILKCSGCVGFNANNFSFLANAKLAKLEHLDLSRNNIDKDGARSLAIALRDATHLSGIKSLNLGANHIGDDGMRHLSIALKYAPHLGSIQSLDFSNNHIASNGTQSLTIALRDGTHLVNLQNLVLYGNIIGNAAALTFIILGRYCAHLRLLTSIRISDHDVDKNLASSIHHISSYKRKLFEEFMNMQISKFRDSLQQVDIFSFIKLLEMLKLNVPCSILRTIDERAYLISELEIIIRSHIKRIPLFDLIGDNMPCEMSDAVDHILSECMEAEDLASAFLIYKARELSEAIEHLCNLEEIRSVDRKALHAAILLAAQMEPRALSVEPEEFISALKGLPSRLEYKEFILLFNWSLKNKPVRYLSEDEVDRALGVVGARAGNPASSSVAHIEQTGPAAIQGADAAAAAARNIAPLSR